MRREAEAMEREEAERIRREEADRMRRLAAEKLRREEAERLKRIEEENARKKEEAKLLEEKRLKDEAMKEKLALLKRNNGGDDFMSQLKANKKTPRSATPNSAMDTLSPETTVQTIQKPEIQPLQPVNSNIANNYNTHDADSSVGYQPSFAPPPEPKKPPGNKPAGRKDPLGLDYSGYTPSFSNQRRGSREEKKQTWTPVGRASVTEKNGFFESQNDKQSILKRRSSQQRNLIKKPTQDELIDDDVEELIL